MAHLRLHPLFSTHSLALALVLVSPACSESHGTDLDVGAADAGGSSDAGGTRDAGGASDGGGSDAGTPDVCDAEDAHAMTCPGAVCDGPDSYAWDGERCVAIPCGTCVGADCGALSPTLEACRAEHASCVPELCKSTGGEWLFMAQECEHYHCGFPVPAECLVGQPVCNCGYGRSFGPEGCFDDTCPVVDPLPADMLCSATGGTWTDGICCSTRCGAFCELACAAPGCVCGEFQIFDPVRGCVDAAECYVRSDGETCTNEATRCEDGLLCCQNCGGAGCDPERYCHAPVCDADPNIDECGNNLLAP